MTATIDKIKRDQLVKKYDLLNFHTNQSPVLMSIDEFFEGNNDEASIAPNLIEKPKPSEYYSVLKRLEQTPTIDNAFVEIKDVMIYQDGKLDDGEWFYTDVIYFVGDTITKEEIQKATESLFPDEVNYYEAGRNLYLDRKFKNKKAIYLWWD